jgi:hypothetical protein
MPARSGAAICSATEDALVAPSSLTWTTERRAGGVLVVSFHGRGGLGSGGNPDGGWMREAIREALADGEAAGLAIDLTGFEYRFGDWIGSVPLVAVKMLGIGRVCVVAVGETAAALRSLWESSRMGLAVPLLGGLEEAVRYLSGSEPE